MVVRRAWLGLAVALGACAAPAQQATKPAQVPKTAETQGLRAPEMPYACDLRSVTIGSWAEYEQTLPGLPVAATERVAAVARGPEGITIETTNSYFPGFVTALLLVAERQAEGRVKRSTFQDGDYDPMENPIQHVHQRDYDRPDSRTLVGEEEVTVPAGTFRTKRHRYKTSYDETVDVWIDEETWPICLIKLEAEMKQPWLASGRFKYELTAKGTGATPKITKPPIPFDIEILKKRGKAEGTRKPPPPPRQ